MITFKQFLSEEKRELVAFLRENCQPACQDIVESNYMLWRGMDGAQSSYEKWSVRDELKADVKFGTVRKDREPRDTPLWAHNVVDDFLEDKFGVRLRSNSLFVYPEKILAGAYGRPHAIIPVGKYSLYWSDEATDLTVSLFPNLASGESSGPAGGEEYWNKKLGAGNEPTADMQIEWIKSRLTELDFKKGSNVEGLRKGRGEMMLLCDRYLAFPLKPGFSADDLEGCIYEALSE
jgi:hypothetical protein